MPFLNHKNKIIGFISILIPIVVAVLILLPTRPKINFNIHVLPAFHAMLNAVTSVLLLVSLYAIVNHKIQLHKMANLTAVVLSFIFLVSYIVYHLFATSTKFGDINRDGIVDISENFFVGNTRYVYYSFLLTHILLAIVVIPFVLYSLVYALNQKIVQHKKISRYTWGIWFYVAVSGVIVYLMIKKYY